MEHLREVELKDVFKWIQMESPELGNLYYEKGFSIEKVGMGENIGLTKLKDIKWFLREDMA